MGHTVGDQANQAVKRSEKKAADAQRTPEERLAAIRGSLAAKLFVTPDDQRFLLELLDAATVRVNAAGIFLEAQTKLIITLEDKVKALTAQVEQFRTVYEQENRSTTVKVERVFPSDAEVQAEFQADADHAAAIADFVDHGGEA